jgi:hypothetical protein
MKIIGTFSITNGMIRVPPGIEGRFTLEVNSNGSFIYHPLKNLSVMTEYPFEVYDGTILLTAFPTEAKAIEYKLEMEKSCGHPIRMKKVFPSAAKNGKIIMEG